MCFVIDLYLKFNHFMYLEEGLIVFERNCIRQKFARDHNTFFEFVASMPVDLLGLVNSRWCFLLRLTKLLRLPQTVESLGHMERILTEIKLDKGLIIRILVFPGSQVFLPWITKEGPPTRFFFYLI